MVDRCGYELLTKLQNFTPKDLTKVKIFLKDLRGEATFFETPGTMVMPGWFALLTVLLLSSSLLLLLPTIKAISFRQMMDFGA